MGLASDIAIWITAGATSIGAVLAWLNYRRGVQKERPGIELDWRWGARDGTYIKATLTVRNRADYGIELIQLRLRSPKLPMLPKRDMGLTNTERMDLGHEMSVRDLDLGANVEAGETYSEEFTILCEDPAIYPTAVKLVLSYRSLTGRQRTKTHTIVREFPRPPEPPADEVEVHS